MIIVLLTLSIMHCSGSLPTDTTELIMYKSTNVHFPSFLKMETCQVLYLLQLISLETNSPYNLIGGARRRLSARGGWTRSRELNRLRAPPMRLYGELVSLLLKPEYSRLRQGSVALIVINRNIIRTRLNP